MRLTRSAQKGFTTIELLITVAIIALLSAMAIPQYQKFIVRSKRASAYVALRSAHAAQTAYYAGTDHYLKGLDTVSTNQYLGLANGQVASNGYTYNWMSVLNQGTGYLLVISADLVHQAAPMDGFKDELWIGIDHINSTNPMLLNCNYQDGVPYLYRDDSLLKTYWGTC